MIFIFLVLKGSALEFWIELYSACASKSTIEGQGGAYTQSIARFQSRNLGE